MSESPSCDVDSDAEGAGDGTVSDQDNPMTDEMLEYIAEDT